MRPVLLSLAGALLLLACSSKHEAASTAEASTVAGDDGSTAGCTSLGGTCVAFAAATCPLLQQNPALCDDTVMVCCLPSGPPVTVPPDAGPPPEPDAGTGAGPVDASSDDGPTD